LVFYLEAGLSICEGKKYTVRMLARNV
jgi:hypothetical protein